MTLEIKPDLLSINDISGSQRLKVFDKIGIIASPTDFAIVCGAAVSRTNYSHKEDETINKAGPYLLKDKDNDHTIQVVNCVGSSRHTSINNRDCCIRLVLDYSKIKDICQNKRYGKARELIVDCGMFPISSLSKELEKELEAKLTLNLLEEIDYITTDCTKNDEYHTKFYGEKQKVYRDIETNKLYTKVKINASTDRVSLSNNQIYKNEDYIWLAYDLVEFVVDEERDKAITRNGIMSGIQFNNKCNYNNFENTDLYYYLNNYLIRDMFSVYLKLMDENSINNPSSQIKLLESKNKDLEAKIINMRKQIRDNNEKIKILSK